MCAYLNTASKYTDCTNSVEIHWFWSDILQFELINKYLSGKAYGVKILFVWRKTPHVVKYVSKCTCLPPVLMSSMYLAFSRFSLPIWTFFPFLLLTLFAVSFLTPHLLPPCSPSFYPAFSHHWLVCFLLDISYHCSSVRSTVPLCFLPRLSLCPRPFVLWPPGSAGRLSAFPHLMLLRGHRPSHLLSPVPEEPARLIKGKQTLRFPPARCKTLLIKE